MRVEKILGGFPVVTDEIDAGHGLARVNEGRQVAPIHPAIDGVKYRQTPGCPRS